MGDSSKNLGFFDVLLECLLGRTSDPSWALWGLSWGGLGPLLAAFGVSWGALGRLEPSKLRPKTVPKPAGVKKDGQKNDLGRTLP